MMTEKELHQAYYQWRHSFPQLDLDKEIAPYLVEEITARNLETETNINWLEKVRTASQLTTESVSGKLGVAKNVYWKIEQSEKAGTVSLNTLMRAAEAMDCELVYAIRPKSRKLFSRIIWEQIYPEAITHAWDKSSEIFKNKGASWIWKKSFVRCGV